MNRSRETAIVVMALRRSLATALDTMPVGDCQHDFVRTLLQLSDDELLEVLSSLPHPNPQRIGCPPTIALVDLARTNTPEGHPALQHIVRCFPCATDVQLLRAEEKRRAALLLPRPEPH